MLAIEMGRRFTRTRPDFAALVVRARRGRELSQQDVADRIGMSRSWIAAVETGQQARPDPEALERLASLLGIDRAQLPERPSYVRPPWQDYGQRLVSIDEKLDRILAGLSAGGEFSLDSAVDRLEALLEPPESRDDEAHDPEAGASRDAGRARPRRRAKRVGR